MENAVIGVLATVVSTVLMLSWCGRLDRSGFGLTPAERGPAELGTANPERD